jgi:hypothetical protein
MAVVTHYLTITKANLAHGHIYLRECKGMFPEDVIGGANKSDVAPRKVQIQWGSDQVETDVVRGKYIFRRRGWVRRFFRSEHVTPGHRVLLEQLGPYSYRVSREPCKEFKCLSIQQPWADLIMNGTKRVENRNLPWRESQDFLAAGERVWLGIHVSSRMTIWKKYKEPKRQHYAPGWALEDSSASGAVVGVVPILQICRHKDLPAELQNDKFTDSGYKWHWVLGKPRKLEPEPFDWPGNASLFRVNVPHRLLPADLR